MGFHPRLFMSLPFGEHVNRNARCPAKDVGHAQPPGRGWSRGAGPGEGIRRWRLPLAGLAAMLLVGIAVGWLATHHAPSRPEPKPRRLTAKPAGNPATDARISPDGKYLAYADQAGIHLQVVGTGESRTIPQPQGLEYKVTGWSPVGWFPDGTRCWRRRSPWAQCVPASG
jgi:hypothetical protein